jgi:SAM-dependent methyltransferase
MQSLAKAEDMTPSSGREERFLAEINRQLPKGVDWKAGAIRYGKAVIGDPITGGELYLFNKPFCCGPNFSPFVDDLSQFVAMVHTLRLPVRSNILDVGSGSGWVSEYFAKLGHSALGIDICDDLLEIARQRVNAALFGAFPGEKLTAEFLMHDIESSPVPVPRAFDLAYFESTLHHFFNPIAVLRNVAKTLKEDGVIAIVEGAAKPVDSEGYREFVKIMTSYQTIERPYSREQLIELLAITGFEHYRFYFPLCGLYEPGDADALHQLVSNGSGWNIVIASRTAAGMTRLCRQGAQAVDAVVFEGGFYTQERDAADNPFRWSRGQGSLRAPGGVRMRLTIGTYPPSLKSRQQRVLVYVNGRLWQTCELTQDHPERKLVLDRMGDHATAEVRFESDCLFLPGWFGLEDNRSLSFWVRAEAGN